ncbi:unnamed protein product [Symbiodinium natans]|uniref:MYND-type domain-containing protein n=1 Tax=Symbiodinium natans TaxID=878477 RepID=A0A812N320_9DINO|nr:unnamed protein product [Symbiodinium natans]
MASRVCNACAQPATKICSRCRCRHYCSERCQREDWRSHKQYCRKPPSKSEEIEALKHLWFGPGAATAESRDSWQRFLQHAGGSCEPSDITKVDVQKLEKIVMDEIKARMPADLEPDPVGYPIHVVKQLRVLPSLPLMDDEFVMSFSTFGHMDHRGHLLYCIMCMSNRTEQVRAVSTCSGAPTATECQSVLFTAMIKPMPLTGDPMRPSQVLLANRWGPDTYETLRPFLIEHGVGIRLESEAEAKLSAAMQDVDSNGFNV